MKFLLLGLALISFAACTKTSTTTTTVSTIACDLGKTVSSVTAGQIAAQLTCANLDAVKATIDAELVKIKICDTTSAATLTTAKSAEFKVQSAIGNVVCAPIVDALATGVLTQIPATWGCTGGPLTDTLKVQLLTACQKAI